MSEFYFVYLNSPEETAEADLKTKIVFQRIILVKRTSRQKVMSIHSEENKLTNKFYE